MITLRKAAVGDKPRIAEISAQIWEGDDYVPEVLHDWLSDSNGELVVAIDDGMIISFAHRSYLLEGYAWFQGARTDPLYRNKGASQKIFHHFLDAVREEKAELIGLSTYIENRSSIHIIEKNGFQKVASFVRLEARSDELKRGQAHLFSRAREISADLAIPYIADSQAMHVANGRFCHGWEFYPFHRDPRRIIAGEKLLGIEEKGKLLGLICLKREANPKNGIFIDFADGRKDVLEDLLRHALYLGQRSDTTETMIPKDEALEAPALDILRQIGFQTEHGFAPDVFVYERKPY